MKTISCSFVRLFKQPVFWLAVLLTLVAISILVKLGMWQLSRAEHKHQLQAALNSNQKIAAQNLATVTLKGNLNGVQVVSHLMPIKEHYLLLDNQIYQGEVGYLALQLMRSQSGKYFLFERGFVAATRSRSELPKVEWLHQQYQGKARLYQRSANPLSNELMLEKTQPRRIQNLNTEQLADYWRLPIEAYVLQPISEQWRYPQPWKPIPMNAEKHTGYAVQWFSMALALAVLALVWLYRAIKSSTKESL